MSEEHVIEENAQAFEINSRSIRIKLIDGSQVNGQINIDREPGYNRLSDLVASSNEPFLILFAVTVFHADSNEPVKYKTLFINKHHIIWASPDSNQR